MDAYEATRIVFSRIQSLDPENAAKIMGLLLIQDHGEKEMIRLAFGPEALVHSVVLKARKDLGLLPPTTPVTPSAAASPSPFLLPRQNSTRLGLAPPPPLSVSSPSSWAPPPVFSRTHSNGSALNGSADDVLVQNPADELVSPSNPAVASPFYGGGDLIDEFQLQDQLSFLNDAQVPSPLPIGSKSASDLFYQDVECRSPSGDGNGMLYPYGVGWGANGHHRRSCSVTDLCLGADPTGTCFGWKPCLYFARGYCKNGSACRFLHGLPDDTAATAAAVAAGSKMDAVVEQQCQELLLRSKSQRLGGASQLMASAFPYSPTVSVPPSPSSSSSKCLNFLLQQQQNENQRAAAAAALMLGGDESHKFIGRSRMERSDFAGMVNPASRQIYLTFPADSTFREEDVSNYFSIYGPVQDVRIPYQQKRMFGFVTFVYPETVKLILAKGNPHFVCDARVLVKPYKEKGKVPDKYRKQQQQAERGDFSGCTTPTGLDSRDPYDLQQLAARMLYNSTSSQELLLRRKLEEQQQAAELQQAIELQNRRFMGLQLLDLKNRSLSSSMPTSTTNSSTIAAPPTITIPPLDSRSNGGSQEDSSSEGSKSFGDMPGSAPDLKGNTASHGLLRQTPVNAADKEESPGETTPNGDSDFQESAEHNLPDSPFASPTKTSFTLESFSAGEADNMAASAGATASYIGSSSSSSSGSSSSGSSSNSHLFTSTLLPATSTLDMATFKSCFFQMPRFSSGHGAIGM